jgi:hypothetical protein
MNVLAVGDVAVLYTDFRGTISDGSLQRTMQIQSKAIEVLRRDSGDDTWKLVVGDPQGRG